MSQIASDFAVVIVVLVGGLAFVSAWLASRKRIAKRVENELEYPGQIKVTVIRKTRAIDYAR